MQRAPSGYQPLAATFGSSRTLPRQQKSVGKRLAVSVALALPTLAIFAALLALSLFGINFSNTDRDYGCDPSGNVWITNANRPNLWSKNYGLAITLGFGSFKFSVAKSVDILWDLIVGRGGQVLAGILLYYNFRGPVVAAMHRAPVPYEKLMKMEYHPAGTTSFLVYCKDVHWKRRDRGVWFTAFMLALSTFYVLTLPTWFSAMSGYQAIDQPYLNLDNSTFVSFASLEQCVYVVADGERIGGNNFTCVRPNTELYDGVEQYIDRYVTYQYPSGWTADSIPAAAAAKSSALTIPGQAAHQLSSPLLNITTNNFASHDSSIYFEGRMFNLTQLQDMSICTPMQQYSWGFSLILLFMWLSITWLLSIFMYLVWLLHYWKSHQLPEEAHKVFGSLRTAMAVTESIRQELGEDVANRLSDGELKKALKDRDAGVSLTRLNQANSFYGLQDMHRKSTRMYRVPSPRRSDISVSTDPRHSRNRSTNSFL